MIIIRNNCQIKLRNMKVMKQSVFVFVILAAVFGSCWGWGWGGDTDEEALQKYKARPQPGFNYFLLALTWPNQYCLSSSRPCNPSVPPQSFTIHGLWPQFTPTKSPQNCDTTEAPTDQLFDQLRGDLLQYWPDLKNAADFDASKAFWRYEWGKHGTCSSNKLSARDYFQKSINLAKDYSDRILNGLQRRGVIPDGRNHSNLDILNAVKDSIGVIPSLGLTDQGRALLEIRLCVADDAVTLINCGDLTFAADPSLSPSPSPSPSPSSSTSQYQYPPSRSTRWWVSTVLEGILKNAV